MISPSARTRHCYFLTPRGTSHARRYGPDAIRLDPGAPTELLPRPSILANGREFTPRVARSRRHDGCNWVSSNGGSVMKPSKKRMVTSFGAVLAASACVVACAAESAGDEEAP